MGLKPDVTSSFDLAHARPCPEVTARWWRPFPAFFPLSTFPAVFAAVVLYQLLPPLPPFGLVGVDGAVLEPPKAPIACFLPARCFLVKVAVENVVVVVVIGFTLRVNMLLLYVAVADDIIMLAESAGFWELGATHSCLGRASWSKREALTVRLPGVLVVPVRM